MNKDFKKLETGSKVAIIGGGPAGSFFALYLLHYAGDRGIRPEITIYQERKFNEPGTKGCKGCAGVLSISLLRNLGELNLALPDEIVQNEIEYYAVHSPYTSVSINNPEKGVHIASIYRGGGPRLAPFKNPVSFDDWLLRQAQNRGARVENRRVSRIHLGPEPALKVAGKELAYDLVVLASGVNTRLLPITGLEYVPPRTRTMALVELYASAAEVESRLGNTAHVFLLPHSGLIFGTLVPKGPFIAVSLLSTGKHPVSVTSFLEQDIVRSVLPERYERVCACQPRAIVSSAHNYYADRFVAVGDAAVSRLYKDGIGSALLTAREAARTTVYHGLASHDFERYYQPFSTNIERDNRWGRLLFSMNNKTKDSRTFLLAQHRLVGDEQNNMAAPQPFTKAGWGMLTGTYSYGSIAWMALGPASVARFLWSFAKESLALLFQRRTARPRSLHIGSRKVLILGSGFGGTYTLRRLVPSLNRNENVETTMVSDENFFLFSPLLHEVAMGRIETRHIAYPIRRLQWRHRFNFIQATVERIDLNARKVVTTAGDLDFDYLVLALGSVPKMPDFNSAEEKDRHLFTVKTLHDSMAIRNHVIEVFEQASTEKDSERQRQLLTFVVVGAGYTGIQVVTELREFVHKTLIKLYKTIDPARIKIILVEAETRIVAELHSKLGAYAIKQLKRMGIEVRLGSRVTLFQEGRVEINSSEIVPANTLIWVAGVVSNPRVAELDVAKDSIGRVLVNEYLEVPDFPDVYAVGDCAHFEDIRSGQPIPPRAHTAVRQARIAAYNILADLRGRDRKPYRYSKPAEMVSLGGSKAMFRFHGLRLYGLPARVIWLVAYSLLVTGTYNRIRVIMDWLLAIVFGRDTAFLKLGKQ